MPRILFLSALWLGCCLGQISDAMAAPETTLPRAVVVNGESFVLIPEGFFWYTVQTGDVNRQPVGAPMFRHVRIWLDSFYLARYEARARDLERFLNTRQKSFTEASGPIESKVSVNTSCTLQIGTDGHWSQTQTERDLPATNLTWTRADEFARAMGFRLPTEAEWEKAARGEDRRIWPWGDNYPDDTYALFYFGMECQPAPVTAYPKGRSPYGIINMAGNVSEYVMDWYNHQFDTRLKDGDRNPPLAEAGTPLPYAGELKIKKGGSWSVDASRITVAQRQLAHVDAATNRDGVRFALDAATVRTLLDQSLAVVETQ